jgi:hypothetical protein
MAGWKGATVTEFALTEKQKCFRRKHMGKQPKKKSYSSTRPGCEMLRMPHCLDNRLTDGSEVVSLTR